MAMAMAMTMTRTTVEKDQEKVQCELKRIINEVERSQAEKNK
jgi:hypothetical protein